ncbi:MAG TPA: SulP family inorganic anion transporter [Rhodanobacteraceae bacterium]|nr:SulP family inorganic anion transporter [Rhodanobacteraceae bacterium]
MPHDPAPRSASNGLLDYDRQFIKPDVVAGLTAAAVVLPKSLAYATVAGLPVEVGLYTSLVPMVIYALLGSSRRLSVSTTTTLAILTATALARVAPDGNAADLVAATATLSLLVGAMLVVASVLRLGFVANFISEPVLIGFKAGIAVVIVVDQIPKLLGIHFPKGPFFQNVVSIVANLPHASLLTLAVAAITAGLLIVLERFAPRVPAPLVAVAVAIAGVTWLGLSSQGVEIVGHVPTGLPSLTWPKLSLVEALWPPALGIALMSFTETIAAGRAFVREGEPQPGANRELVATGIANAGGALLGAMPAGGGTSQTAVNLRAGARTQAACLVTAATALGTMLILAPLIGLMPQATLAAVVIVYSVGLIQPVEFRAILRVRRTEFVWALVAMIGVVLLGTLQGILVAIVVSLVALAHQLADLPVYVLVRKRGTRVFRPVSDEHPDDESVPGILVLRPEGRVFFANAEQVGQKMQPLIAAAKPEIVVLDLGGVFDVEYTALKMLIAAERTLRERGIALWVVGLNPRVLPMVRRSPLGETLGSGRMFYTVDQAVERHLASRTAS